MRNERVQVISDTEQYFDGKRYKLHGKYFGRSNARLHRVVWSYHHGSIPPGYEIHHKDEDRSNNQIENLEILERSKHRAMHAAKESSKAKARRNIRKGVDAARKWHGSPEGIKWHKQQYQRIKDKLHITKTEACGFCGEVVEMGNTGKYCSNKCRQAAYRNAGKYNIEKDCPICGTKFTTSKYKPTQTCGRTCGSILQGHKMSKSRAGRT